MSQLEGLARAWMAVDPDEETRNATLAMIAAGDAALQDAFGDRLQFGTAGLRGAMGPGPNRMNRVIVRLATAGLAAHLADLGLAGRPVVIGYDGRKNSRRFAEDAAAVLHGRGFKVYLFDDVVPTPVLAYATPALGCGAGIMVTASHNPPADNGYKTYLSTGAQIIPPHDRQISAHIDALGLDVGAQEYASLPAGAVLPVPSSVLASYEAAIDALRTPRPMVPVRVVYTAMHGVGRRQVEAALRRAGHTDLHIVAEQAEPDPDFPTVKFPNPEEPGALDLAIALARKVDAKLIIANDPDADRLAVAVPDGQGGWRQLTGNQVGILLAEDRLSTSEGEGRMVACSIVSTAMLRVVAAAHGAGCVETLTGFKWIGDAAITHEAAGGRFILGFEEALGYSAGSVVRDKDGVSACLLIVDLASALAARGLTLSDAMEAAYRKYGLFVSGQVARTLPGREGAAKIAAAMAALRENPPRSLGGLAVDVFSDLTTGEITDLRDGRTSRSTLPPGDVLAFDLAGGSRVLARPSGTEPKIKFYFEVCEPVTAGEPMADAHARAAVRMKAMQSDLLAVVGW